MTQNLNFLKFTPKTKDFLSAKIILASGVTLLFLLLGVSAALGVNQYYLSQELEQAQQKRMVEDRAFQTIAQKNPLFTADKPLVDQVSEFETLFRAKKEEFDRLTHATLRKPFSSYLKTLSQVVPDGLWLTTIDINQDTKNVSISGYSLQPVFVSTLMQALQTPSAFDGISFDLFYVRKLEDRSYIEFEIANDKLINTPENENKNTTNTNNPNTRP